MRPSCSTSGPTSPGWSPPTRRLDSVTTAFSRWPTRSTRAATTPMIVTLEADGSGAIYPVLYTRLAGAVNEHPLQPDPLLRYDTAGDAGGAGRGRRPGAAGERNRGARELTVRRASVSRYWLSGGN